MDSRRSPKDIDSFVRYDRIKWSRDLKLDLTRQNYAAFDLSKVRPALYRPFVQRTLFLDRILNEEVYQHHRIFPETESANRLIWLKVGSDWPMFALAADCMVDLLPQGGSQCFPFLTYPTPDSPPAPNITESALSRSRQHYSRQAISREDIFHYVYAILHHPGYRERYAENLEEGTPPHPLRARFPGIR